MRCSSPPSTSGSPRRFRSLSPAFSSPGLSSGSRTRQRTRSSIGRRSHLGRRRSHRRCHDRRSSRHGSGSTGWAAHLRSEPESGSAGHTRQGGSRMRYPILLLLAAGALTLAGCGGKSSSPNTTTVAETTTTEAATTEASTTTAGTTTAAAPVTIRVVIKDGKPVGGIQRATVKKGQKIAIVVHSDVADEVHVHGYDLHKDVTAGGTVRIAFPATITGVFEAELESRGLQIVEFTVE